MPNKKHLCKHALVYLTFTTKWSPFFFFNFVYLVSANKQWMRGSGRERLSSLVAWPLWARGEESAFPRSSRTGHCHIWALLTRIQRTCIGLPAFSITPIYVIYNSCLFFAATYRSIKSTYLPNVDLFLLTSQQWYPKREDRLTENIAAAKNKNMMWNLAWVSGRPF